MNEERSPEEQKSSASESLWPAKIQPVRLKAPAVILKEQASLLGQMTQNIVRADVRMLKQDPSSDTIGYGFVLVAPALSNYTFWLFFIQHKVTELYPVAITSQALPPKDRYVGEWKAENEDQFREVLKTLFNDERTSTAIQSLMAQSGSSGVSGGSQEY